VLVANRVGDVRTSGTGFHRRELPGLNDNIVDAIEVVADFPETWDRLDCRLGEGSRRNGSIRPSEVTDVSLHRHESDVDSGIAAGSLPRRTVRDPAFVPLDVKTITGWTTLNWMIEDMVRSGHLVLHRGEYTPKVRRPASSSRSGGTPPPRGDERPREAPVSTRFCSSCSAGPEHLDGQSRSVAVLTLSPDGAGVTEGLQEANTGNRTRVTGRRSR
jgi:hypothetical protein